MSDLKDDLDGLEDIDLPEFEEVELPKFEEIELPKFEEIDLPQFGEAKDKLAQLDDALAKLEEQMASSSNVIRSVADHINRRSLNSADGAAALAELKAILKSQRQYRRKAGRTKSSRY